MLYFYGLTSETSGSKTYTLIAAPGAFGLSGRYNWLNVNAHPQKLTDLEGNVLQDLGGNALLAVNSFYSAFALPGAAGAFLEVANTSPLKVHRNLPGAAGAYGETGNPAPSHLVRGLHASPGSFVELGFAITTVKAYKLPGSSGTFARSGLPLTVHFGVNGAPGAFGLGGGTLIFGGKPTLSEAPGAFGLLGHAIVTRVSYHLGSAAGAFHETGSAGGTGKSYTLVGNSGSYLIGKNLTPPVNNTLSGVTGGFSLTGKTAPLKISRGFIVPVPSYQLGSAATSGGGPWAVSGYIVANPYVAAQSGNAVSASAYVVSGSGFVSVALYDATGPGGGPGNLLASTASTSFAIGWNTLGFISPSGTTIPGTASSITDVSGNTWTLSPASNGTALLNGTEAGTNYNTTQVLFYDGAVYIVNTGGQWFTWNGSGWSVVANPNAPPPIANATELVQGATYWVALQITGGNAYTSGGLENDYVTFAYGPFPQVFPAGVSSGSGSYSATVNVSAAIPSFNVSGDAAALHMGRNLPGVHGVFGLAPLIALAKFGLSEAPGVFGLTGHALSAAFHWHLGGATGAFGLAGGVLKTSHGYGFSGAAGAFAKTGVSGAFGFGLPATPGSFAESGAQLNFTVHTGHSAYSFNAPTGAFGVAGSAAPLRLTLHLGESAGSFATAGKAASFVHGYALAALPGSRVLTGSGALTKKTVGLAAAGGTFAETGVFSNFTVHIGYTTYGFTVPPGAFGVAGNPLVPRVTWHAAGAAGSLGVTGRTSSPVKGFNLPGAPGSRVLAGIAAGGKRGVKLAGAAGAFAEAGGSLNFTVNTGHSVYSLTAVPGGFGLSPRTMKPTHGYGFSGAGSFAVNGTGISVRRAYHFPIAAGAFGESGRAAVFPGVGQHGLSAAKGIYGLYGNGAALTVGKMCAGNTGVFNGTGIFASGFVQSAHSTDTGFFSLVGSDAFFTLSFAYTGPGYTSVLIPNDRFPVDLILYRVLGNRQIPGYVESTFQDVQIPFANDDDNFGLAWYGPFPPRGTPVRFIRPSTTGPTLVQQVSLFS